MTSRKALAALALVALVAACTPQGTPEPEPTETPEEVGSVQVVTAPFFGYAPIRIADVEGYFLEHGVEVELVEVPSPNEYLAAFLNGDVDVWAGTLGPGLFNAIHGGADVRVVAERGRNDPDSCAYFGLLVRQDVLDRPDWGTPEGVRGLKVGGGQSMTTMHFQHRVLAEIGLTLDDVELMDIDRGAMQEALGSGVIDAIADTEPRLTQIMREVPSAIWKGGNEVVPGEPIGIIAFGPRLLHDEPELAERFMAAYLAGVEQYNEGPTDRNVEVLSEATRLEPDLLTEICWSPIAEDGLIDIAAVQRIQEFALERGDLDAVVRPERWWEPRFAEDAVERRSGGA